MRNSVHVRFVRKDALGTHSAAIGGSNRQICVDAIRVHVNRWDAVGSDGAEHTCWYQMYARRSISTSVPVNCYLASSDCSVEFYAGFNADFRGVFGDGYKFLSTGHHKLDRSPADFPCQCGRHRLRTDVTFAPEAAA